jgi:hypothetical protein
MADDLVIHVKGSGTLPQPAHSALEQDVRRYANMLFNEAKQLEARQRNAQGPVEITSTMIHDANRNVVRGYVRPRRSASAVAWQTVTYVATFVGGGFAGYVLEGPIGSIGFAVCGLIGLVAFFMGGRE